MNINQDPTLECPICHSLNTFRRQAVDCWKCNDCGYNFNKATVGETFINGKKQ